MLLQSEGATAGLVPHGFVKNAWGVFSEAVGVGVAEGHLASHAAVGAPWALHGRSVGAPRALRGLSVGTLLDISGSIWSRYGVVLET